MKCPKCEEGEMESMGYGDRMCSNKFCKHTEYSESDEDFRERFRNLYPKDSE